MSRSAIQPKGGKPKICKDIDEFNFQYIPTILALLVKEETLLIFEIDVQLGKYIDVSLLKLGLGMKIMKSDG